MNEMEIAKIEEDHKTIFHDITFNNIFFKEIFDFINVIINTKYFILKLVLLKFNIFFF
jgi:hypothetical protein